MPLLRPFALALSLLGATAALAQPKPQDQPEQPFVAPSPPPEVKIGGRAPKLEVEKWLKGTPVESLDKGIFVIEMWATWCAPCVRDIPHLTALQKQHKDQVRFIGVNIWEDSVAVEKGTYLERATTFVNNMGDKMDYTVAYGGNSPAPMFTTWMMASGQTGIPCAFLIKDGRVQWFGHPVALERALKKVLEGTLNVKDPSDEKTKEAANEAEKARKVRNLSNKVLAAHNAGDTATVNKLIDELIELAPEEFTADFQTRAEEVLAKDGEAAWYTYTRRMTAGPLKSEPVSLEYVASVILGSETIKDRDADLALDLASRAVRLTNEQNAGSLNTLAAAYWAKNDAANAAATQEKAIKALRQSEESQRAEYAKALEKYKAGTK